MNKIAKRISFLLASLIIIMTVLEPITAFAKVPYRTYTQNGYGEFVETQTAYTPSRTISKIINPNEGEDDLVLKGALDLKVSGDLMYIADTSNKRIIIADLEGNLIKTFGRDILDAPSGLYITDEYIYVADPSYVAKKEGAIVIFDKEGNYVAEYAKPDSLLYGTSRFQPVKLAVDNRGNMYIVCTGNTNGIVQITPTDGGTFLGYFGTNTTQVSATNIFLNLILSEKAKARLIGNSPIGFTNVNIDEKGLIYSVTAAEAIPDPVRKLNVAGANMLKADIYPYKSATISTGKYDNIYVATSYGYIFEYSSEGSLLFVFGGYDGGENRVGLFQNISAISNGLDDSLYVLDSKLNEIQVFVPTEFTNLLHESLVLYQKGLYSQSKEPLEKVIRMNGLFDFANQAMGSALFQEENYSEALEYYRLAKDKAGYSEAFWELRNVWLNNNIMYLILGIVLLVFGTRFIKFADRKWRIFDPLRKATKKLRDTMLYKRLMFVPKYMRHPMDGTYGVKREGMASYISAAILIAIFIVFNIISKYFGGFLFKTVKDGRYNIPTDILMVLGILIFASAVTYLICTINEGESRFKEILCGYVYSLSPYLIMQPIIYVAGMVLTNNESFLIEFANLAMLIWIVILIFLTIKEVNNYSVKETFKVIGLTIFTAFVFILMAFVVYILAMQVIGFVVSIVGEVVYRIGK